MSATTLHLAVGLGTRAGAGTLRNAALGLDGVADILTIEDRFADPAGDGPDAAILANWLAPLTREIGLVAGAPVSVVEPFHVSTAIATLDHVSEGRAGLLLQSPRGAAAERARRAIGALNGFPQAEPQALARDALETLEAIRLLWDSWEDDAVIRDLASQRFVDGSKLHYIEFEGTGFRILGPSITPRPPQGRPPVAAFLDPDGDAALARAADLVFLSGTDRELEQLAADLPQGGRAPLLFADIAFASQREAPGALAERVRELARRLGLAGLRFLPVEPERDVEPLISTVLPALRPAASTLDGTLRERLGLPPAPNRYAARPRAAA